MPCVSHVTARESHPRQRGPLPDVNWKYLSSRVDAGELVGDALAPATAAQRLPDSPDCLARSCQVLEDSTTDHTLAFPTDSRQRRKEREREAKEKGEVIPVQKKQFRVEDHYDDCGEDVSLLEAAIHDSTLFVDELRIHPDFAYLTHFDDQKTSSPYSSPTLHTLFGTYYTQHDMNSASVLDTSSFFAAVTNRSPTYMELSGLMFNDMTLIAYYINNFSENERFVMFPTVGPDGTYNELLQLIDDSKPSVLFLNLRSSREVHPVKQDSLSSIFILPGLRRAS